MNIHKTEIASRLHETFSKEQEAGTRYQMRTECREDCGGIRAVLRPWLLSWKESSGYQADDSYVDATGVVWASQNWALDTDVQFIIGMGGPTLREVRWLFDKITDCHVATDTVQLDANYTGERLFQHIQGSSIDTTMTRPSAGMLELSIETLKIRRDLAANAAAIAIDAVQTLQRVVGTIQRERRHSSKGTKVSAKSEV
jgi:hypothetical protein